MWCLSPASLGLFRTVSLDIQLQRMFYAGGSRQWRFFCACYNAGVFCFSCCTWPAWTMSDFEMTLCVVPRQPQAYCLSSEARLSGNSRNREPFVTQLQYFVPLERRGVFRHLKDDIKYKSNTICVNMDQHNNHVTFSAARGDVA